MFLRLRCTGLAIVWVAALATLLPSCTKEKGTTVPEPPPACQVTPDTLAFGTVAVGMQSDRPFTLTNTGGGTLSGTVGSACGSFSVVSGGGDYALQAGEFHTVKVRFRPTTIGPGGCSISTGTSCGALICSGTGGEPAPACSVDPANLDFGNVPLNHTETRSFAIRNSGGGTLIGNVTIACSDYRLAEEPHPFQLAAGEADTVTVLFTPTGCGVRTCSVMTGAAGCAAVSCVGSSEGPGCTLSVRELDFGAVALGHSADQSFRIANDGCEVLSGTLGEGCGGFRVQSGTGPFTLARGQSRTVTVRFTPSTCDTVGCTIDTGLPACGSVICKGSGNGVRCEIVPAGLDFGSVPVGSPADGSFTIRNTGCGPVTGSVAPGCGDFTTTGGSGAYALSPGESLEVVVRFQPSACGDRSCSLDLGDPLCGSISCVGSGAGAACEVAPTSLSFGVVAVGEFADRAFTITNTGCVTMEGRFSETCSDYSIQDGGGAYALSHGDSRTVTVRFQPTGAGPRSCTIETGSASCGQIECAGTGGSASCSLDPSGLDFGNVPDGETKDLSLRITNEGTQALDGSIPAVCGDFEVTEGGGVYEILPGTSRDVVVRFHASGCGARSCSLDLGNTKCGSIDCTATSGGTACSIAPDSLDFGAVRVGQTADRTFTITNAGCETIAADVTESCDVFEIVSGGGNLLLDPGDVRTVTVRFQPLDCTVRRCSILTGNDVCGSIVSRGSGIAAFCAIAPDSLDYGPVPVGDYSDLSFTIRNTGCDILAGNVTEACGEFSILAGAGTYALAPGAERLVTVRFEPTGCGAKLCTVSTGAAECPGVVCSGLGGGVGCLLDPAAIDFGRVAVGQTKDLSFRIQNTGCDAISGSVSESCADVSLISGGGDYTLDPGASRTVSVRFAPTGCGAMSCSISTGLAECPSVSCTGASDVPACVVNPALLDFGTVAIGGTVERNFTIRNSGCGVLSGGTSLNCADYSIVRGGGAFQIPSGESLLVTVRFAPTGCGSIPCTVATGTALCETVSCTGSGTGTQCAVSPPGLDFGTVAVGETADRSFTITNTGCVSFSGLVSESCPDYTITAGGGGYTLAPGEEHSVTVRFAPTGCGSSGCTIATGTAACGTVGATGVGGGTICSVAPSSLDFGTVAVGTSATRDFTITNDGCTTLDGTVGAACADYSFDSGGGAYSLAPGASRPVTVRFTPASCGVHACTITTGAGCADVAATGTGGGTVCSVVPTLLDFGTTYVGEFVDRSFTIRNTGCDPLQGLVGESCPDFDIVSGGGAYDLASGDSVVVTVRFQPVTPGAKLCTVDAGDAACSDVSCGGRACPASPMTFDANMDATIRSGAPDQNACTETLVYVGVDTLVNGTEWALFSFDLSAIPTDAVVTSAVLTVYADGCDPPPDAGSVSSDLVSLKGSWSECSVTWNTAPSGTILPCTVDLVCASPGDYLYTCASLGAVVQGWVRDPAANYGFGLQPTLSVQGAAAIRSHRFASNPPQLEVRFTCP